MRVVYEVIEYIASYVELFVLYKIYGEILHNFHRGFNNRKECWLTGIGAAAVWICNKIEMFSYFTIIFVVLYGSITALTLYKTNYISLFSIASFYSLCVSCFDFFIVTTASSMWNGKQTLVELMSSNGLARVFLIILVKSIWIMFFYILKGNLKMFENNLKQKYVILIISILGFIGFIFLVEQTCHAFDYRLAGIWLLSVVILAFVLFSLYYIVARREEKIKLEFAEAHNTLLEENYKVINQMYVNNAKLYHDMNNHLNILYQLVNEGNLEKAKSYIKEIGKPITALSKVVWTGDDVVDAVINSKLSKMNEKGIVTDINVEFPSNTNILQNDMCTILANLLDNSIEALEKLDYKGRVWLTVRRINQILLIKVENDCIDDGSQFRWETSKNDKILHGWGLANVRDTVEKYNGTIECKKENNKFVVTIMLFFTLK